MALYTELPIYKHGCALLDLALDVQVQLPRVFKRSLGDRIHTQCVSMLEAMAMANASRDGDRVAQLDTLLQHLRATTAMLRVSHDKRLISPKLWARSVELLDAVGAQAGGWRKQTLGNDLFATASATTGDAEEWRAVVDFERYAVSNLGQVRSTTGLLKLRRDRGGYLQARMYKNRRYHVRAVQRLVAEAWIGPRPAGHIVRHRDGDRTNNRSTNLQYGTPLDNAADKLAHGTVSEGERNGLSKLTEEQVRMLRSRYVKGDPDNGASAISRELDVSHQTVRAAAKRLTWKHI